MKRALAVLFVLGAAGCGTFRAGEAMVAQSGAIRVRLVRYYHNMAFDYIGYKYDIECTSPFTDRRWINLDTSTEYADYNDNSAPALAARVRTRLTITADDVVIWTGLWSIVFGFEGCREVKRWWPPSDMFEGFPESLRFRDVHADRGGAISFIVGTAHGGEWRATSSDRGAHWHYERMK